MSVRPNEWVIDDHNLHTVIDCEVGGQRMMRGLVPRDYNKIPVGSMSGVPGFDPSEIELIPFDQIPALIKKKENEESRLSDTRLIGNFGKIIPSLNQGQKGYCWAHSSTHATILSRASSGMPYAPLSAYAIACIIKNYRDEGAWGALSLDFIRERGVPDQKHWPQGSMSRSNDNPDTWKNAEQYKVTEGWIDLDTQAYDRNLTFQQFATCLIKNIPVVCDYNWWSHSVLGMDLLDLVPSLKPTDINRYGVRIWNSWGDEWSDRGMGILKGQKCVPNGAVAVRSVRAA